VSIPAAFSRRDFLKAGAVAGAGLTLAIYLEGCGREPGPPPTDAPFAPSAWLRIRPDGSITVMVDRSEMGQGVSTALPMLVAEELDADWNLVRFEAAPANKAYANPFMNGMQGTGGSSAVRAAWQPLRLTGARARAMLVSAAATAWDVAPAACRTEQGRVYHDASGRSLGYGELATAAGKLPVPEEVPLKDPKNFRIIGRAMPRLDLLDVVRGADLYSLDVRLPGMLTAVVARCPVFGGKLQGFDASRARAIPGVRAVEQIDSGVAVIADSYYQAKLGRDALKVTWDEGPLAGLDSAGVTARLKALAEGPDQKTVRDDGDAEAALGRAVRKAEAVYEVPFLAHATMEPMNCVADVREGRCTVWAPTQIQWAPRTMGGGTQGAAAKAAGVPMDKVTVLTTRLGGGFGRRSEMDFVIDAVQASKAVGKPVKVVWSREDDIQHDFYRPATYNILRGGLDESGRLVAWTHRIAGPSIMQRLIPGFLPEFVANRLGLLKHGADPTSVESADNIPYAVPNVRVQYARAELGVPVGFWRSVGSSQNGFIAESFVDELAHLAEKDPVEFRRSLLSKYPRHLGVLDLVAERAGWGTPPAEGRARGIAVVESFGSYVAEVAEVSVTNGKVRVHRVVCAVDCGTVVNPDTVEAQMQSGIVFGLTAALYGAVTLKKGRVEQSNFHDYPMLRMNEMPVVEVHIVPSAEPPGGVGEPATPPIAPAVTNAIFALTGTRVRKLPIAL